LGKFFFMWKLHRQLIRKSAACGVASFFLCGSGKNRCKIFFVLGMLNIMVWARAASRHGPTKMLRIRLHPTTLVNYNHTKYTGTYFYLAIQLI
jgi:hypothetical protein